MNLPGRIPVVSVVGWSNSGKTTFIEQLIEYLQDRGYRVGTVKHHHGNIDMDTPGKDTWRHARAGAEVVSLAGNTGFIVYRNWEESDKEMLAEIARCMSGMDIVLVEGFKSMDIPKIEISSAEKEQERATLPGDEVIYLVENNSGFTYEEVEKVAELLEKYYLRPAF